MNLKKIKKNRKNFRKHVYNSQLENLQKKKHKNVDINGDCIKSIIELQCVTHVPPYFFCDVATVENVNFFVYAPPTNPMS